MGKSLSMFETPQVWKYTVPTVNYLKLNTPATPRKN